MQHGRFVGLIFYIGIIGKGIDGVLEVAGGVLLLLVDPVHIYNVVRVLTQHELSRDPHDVVATYILNGAQHLSTATQAFAAFYLVGHGLVKVILVMALLLKKRWAYPAAIVAFLFFVVYQLYRYSHTHSPPLLVLSAADVIVIVFTWLEYKRLRSSHSLS